MPGTARTPPAAGNRPSRCSCAGAGNRRRSCPRAAAPGRRTRPARDPARPYALVIVRSKVVSSRRIVSVRRTPDSAGPIRSENVVLPPASASATAAPSTAITSSPRCRPASAAGLLANTSRMKIRLPSSVRLRKPKPTNSPSCEQGIFGRPRGQVTEEAVLVLGAGGRRECVEQLFRGRIRRKVDRRGQRLRVEVPVAHDVEHPLLARGFTTRATRGRAAAIAAPTATRGQDGEQAGEEGSRDRADEWPGRTSMHGRPVAVRDGVSRTGGRTAIGRPEEPVGVFYIS